MAEIDVVVSGAKVTVVTCGDVTKTVVVARVVVAGGVVVPCGDVVVFVVDRAHCLVDVDVIVNGDDFGIAVILGEVVDGDATITGSDTTHPVSLAS